LNTKNFTLIPHVPAHLLALAESVDAYEKISGIRAANGVIDFLLSASPEFMARLRAATEPDPWQFGFAVIHKIDNVLIGMAGFPGPPSDGVAEIAYASRRVIRGKVSPPKSLKRSSNSLRATPGSEPFARTPFRK